jgi:hypothetical protein
VKANLNDPAFMDASRIPVATANALPGRTNLSTLKGYAEYIVERAKERRSLTAWWATC